MKKIAIGILAMTCAGSAAYAFLPLGEDAQLFVTAKGTARYDDNITMTANTPTTAGKTAKVSDTIFEVDPGLALEFGKNAKVYGSLGVAEAITRYYHNPDLNTNLFGVNAAVNYGRDSDKLKVGTTASYNQINENTPTAGTVGLLRRNVWDAGVTAELQTTAKSSVVVGGEYGRTDYALDQYTDTRTYTVPVTAYFEVPDMPKLQAGAGFRYRQTDMVLSAFNTNPGYRDLYYSVNARGEFTPKLSGTASIGYNVRENRLAGISNSSSIGADFGLTYALTAKTQLSLNASNDFGNAAAGTSQKVSSISFGANTAINEQWGTFQTITYNRIQYPSLNRLDEYWSGSLGASYKLNQYFTFTGTYTYKNNSSDAVGNGYNDNVVSFGVSVRY